MPQPPQPPIVTLICREAWKNVPSLNLATAITSWVSASRMRVEASGTLMGENDLTELQIAVDKTFIPAVVSNGARKDPRELGVRVFHAFVDPR